MPKFNAATVVEPLEWTFHPLLEAKGVIKEPTDDQIVTFLTDVKDLVTRLQAKAATASTDVAVPGTDPADIVDAIEDLDPAVVGEFHQELAGVFAELCSGEPSKELLLQLPMRIRVVFYGWLRQEVMAPEAAPGGGSAQVTTLRPAAAG